MIRHILRWPLHAGRATALLLATAAAYAEPLQAPPQTVTVLAYESAFTAYKSYTDQPVTSWRDANDTVGRMGGWRSYARESAREATSASSATSQDDGHGDRHGGRP